MFSQHSYTVLLQPCHAIHIHPTPQYLTLPSLPCPTSICIIIPCHFDLLCSVLPLARTERTAVYIFIPGHPISTLLCHSLSHPILFSSTFLDTWHHAYLVHLPALRYTTIPSLTLTSLPYPSLSCSIPVFPAPPCTTVPCRPYSEFITIVLSVHTFLHDKICNSLFIKFYE